MDQATTTRNLEREIIAKWSVKAMEEMEKNSVQPMPNNYAVWYEYVRGANKRLVHAINTHIKDKKPFSFEVSQQLYEAFLSSPADTEVVEKATDRTQKIMEDILRTINTSSEDTKLYNKELDTFAQIATKGGDIKSALQQIVSQTALLKKKGEELNKKLASSQTEVQLLKENLSEMRQEMNQDALTGVGNRKSFDEAINRLMEDSKTNGRPLCLLMLDVDHFKNFNDSFGHLLGDQVLRVVAGVMKDLVKGKDFVGRYGGEEFAILLPDTPINGAKIVAENIRKAISTKELKRKDSGESYGKVTVSIGISSYRMVGDKPEDIIGRADKALYYSKQNGRNQVTLES